MQENFPFLNDPSLAEAPVPKERKRKTAKTPEAKRAPESFVLPEAHCTFPLRGLRAGGKGMS